MRRQDEAYNFFFISLLQLSPSHLANSRGSEQALVLYR